MLRTIASSHGRPLSPRNPANDRNARRNASWTTSSRIVVVARQPARQVVGGVEVRQRDLLEAPALRFCRSTVLPRFTAMPTDRAPDLFPERAAKCARGNSPSRRTQSCTVQTLPGSYKERIMDESDRSGREFLKLAGVGGVVFASGLGGRAHAAGEAAGKAKDDFYFVQLSDTHWGFEGPPNPDAKGTLKKAVAAVNSLSEPPDFVVFTGDLTHTTDDPQGAAAADDAVPRHRRRAQGQGRSASCPASTTRRSTGARRTRNSSARRTTRSTTRACISSSLDNVSDPAAQIGDEQLRWLAADLAKQLPKDANIVVFTHRPLFDLYPQWDWATRDGAKAVELLMPHPNVTVFYGHIHQEHHHMTGHIAHHSAKSLMFPLPAPGSQPKRRRVPWDPAQPYRGLGFRSIEAEVEEAGLRAHRIPGAEGVSAMHRRSRRRRITAGLVLCSARGRSGSAPSRSRPSR